MRTKVEQRLRGGDEQRAVAREQCGVDDILRNHRLAETLRRDEDNVACFGQEAELEYGVDELPIDVRRPLPIEVGHGSKPTEMAAVNAALEAALCVLGLLELGDVLRISPIVNAEPVDAESRSASSCLLIDRDYGW